MSKALFEPAGRTERLLATLFLVLLATTAPAASVDRDQPINVRADHFEATQREGLTILTGHVLITQGSLKATADKATAHRDANGDFNRIVMQGAPATLQQQLDRGADMRGRADSIDYAINDDIVTLTGHAHVERSDQGSFDGTRLVYNTVTGAIEGSGGDNGQVELVLKPRRNSNP